MGLTVTVPLATPGDASVRLSGFGAMLALNAAAGGLTTRLTGSVALLPALGIAVKVPL